VQTTKNGFALAPRAGARETFVVNGLSFTTLRGDLADVFQYIAAEFDQRVETLTHRSSYRSPATNKGDVDSNHMSATAIDLNGFWPRSGRMRHPYEKLLPARQRDGGYDDGFDASQRAEIRRILATVNGTRDRSAGVIQWGLDYGAPFRDSMHFQVRGGMGSAEIAAAADRVRRRRGRRRLAMNGRLDTATIRAWQRAESTTVDGTISRPTSELIEAVQRSINARNAEHEFLADGPLAITGRLDDRDRVALVKTLNELHRRHRFLEDGPLSTTRDLRSARRNNALKKALNLGLWT